MTTSDGAATGSSGLSEPRPAARRLDGPAHPGTIGLALYVWAPIAALLLVVITDALQSPDDAVPFGQYLPAAVVSTLFWSIVATLVRRRRSAPVTDAVGRGLIIVVGSFASVLSVDMLLNEPALLLDSPSVVLPAMGWGLFALILPPGLAAIVVSLLGSVAAWHLARAVRAGRHRSSSAPPMT